VAPAALALLLFVPGVGFAQHHGGHGGGHAWGGHAWGGHVGGYRGGWVGHVGGYRGGWGGYHNYGWGGYRSGWGGWPYIGFGLGYPYYSGYGYGSPYYSSSYYVSPIYSSNYYVEPYYSSVPVYTPGYVESSYAPVVTNPPASTTTTTVAPATVEVRVPANAEVWFGDFKTSQTGSDRVFSSPPLPRDRDYTYQVRARWMENGQPVERTREVHVTGGQSQVVDFMSAE
jgi:uncharacterized protein (TIGR03000 family)